MGILERQGKRLYRPTRQTDPGTDATAALPCCRAAALLPCCAVAHPPISAWKASEERASRGRNPMFTPTLPAPTRSSHTTSCTGMQQCRAGLPGAAATPHSRPRLHGSEAPAPTSPATTRQHPPAPASAHLGNALQGCGDIDAVQRIWVVQHYLKHLLQVWCGVACRGVAWCGICE
jgi:hypothetical protein